MNECKHEFVWFRDVRDSSIQVGEYLEESYFCQKCGEIKLMMVLLDAKTDN